MRAAREIYKNNQYVIDWWSPPFAKGRTQNETRKNLDATPLHKNLRARI